MPPCLPAQKSCTRCKATEPTVMARVPHPIMKLALTVPPPPALPRAAGEKDVGSRCEFHVNQGEKEFPIRR